MNRSKIAFFRAICNQENEFITDKLKSAEYGAFDLEVTPNGFALLDDSDGSKMAVNHDQFFEFLFTTDFLHSVEEYDHFITMVGKDIEIHNELEKFYYTEVWRSNYRNGIVYGSYSNCFNVVEPVAKQTTSPAPYDMQRLSEADSMYLELEEMQEAN